MSKNNENKLLPKLRFPEFLQDREWKQEVLGEICDYWNGGSHENGVIDDGEYNLISLNSIDIYGNLKQTMKKLSYTDNSLQRNDLVMVLSDVAHGNFLGLTDIIPNEKYVLNQRMAGLRIKKLSFANPQFIRTYINKNQKYFKRKGQGSSQLNLSKSSVTEFPVLKPPTLEEQQKIGACLHSLDTVIRDEGKKLEVLKEHKKGLLQNLLPQEGEMVPKVKFKEFADSGEWVDGTLIDLCEINPKVSQLPDEFVYIDLESVDKGKLQQKKIIKREEAPSRAQRFLTDRDVIYQTVRPYQRNNYHFKKNDDFDYVASTGYAQLRAYQSSDFLFQLIHTDSFVSKVIEKCSGSNYPAVNSTDLSKIEILFPANLNEQQKIASTLSSIDELITAQAQKIEALQLHKKGLLQGLFPKINEVTE
ncbi:MAG: restriction endonuclease subunit S [Flavobacteriales bacterium]|jgi:type I restriction enzyme S subunit